MLRAVLAVWDGDVDLAVAASQAAVPRLQAGDDAELVALSVAGICLGFAGDREAAVLAYERAIARAEEVGETFRRSFALSGLGELFLASGDDARATELVTEALRMKAELDDQMGIAVALDCLGRIALDQSRIERAAVLLGAAHAIWDAIGMRETGNPFAQTSSPWRACTRPDTGWARPPSGPRSVAGRPCRALGPSATPSPTSSTRPPTRARRGRSRR